LEEKEEKNERQKEDFQLFEKNKILVMKDIAIQDNEKSTHKNLKTIDKITSKKQSLQIDENEKITIQIDEKKNKTIEPVVHLNKGDDLDHGGKQEKNVQENFEIKIKVTIFQFFSTLFVFFYEASCSLPVNVFFK